MVPDSEANVLVVEWTIQSVLFYGHGMEQRRGGGSQPGGDIDGVVDEYDVPELVMPKLWAKSVG